MIDPKTADFSKVTVILRGYSYEQSRCVVEAMVGTKLGAVEIAMNTPGAPEIIEKLAKEFGDEVCVGAGTVISAERAHAAVKAGAKFALSPICFTQEIMDICKEAGMFTVPAAFSPTEVWSMFEMGADIVKIFPAIELGPRYLKDIQAPLNPMPLMVVGGVNANNVQEYFDAGASYAGIASGIFNPDDIKAMNQSALREQIAELEKKINW